MKRMVINIDDWRIHDDTGHGRRNDAWAYDGARNDERDGSSGIAQMDDSRISLGLPAPMRHKQLAMMREHLRTVNDIVALISEGKFNAASQVAHSKLGLTPEMKKMCDMFTNSDFRQMGLAFHQSADEWAMC